MSAKAADILGQLTALPPGELRKLRAAIDTLPGAEAGPGVSEGDEELVWSEASALLRKVGLSLPRPYNTGSAKFYRRNVPVLMGYVREQFDPGHRAELVKAVRQVLELVVADLKGRGKLTGEPTVALRIFCHALKFAPVYVERAFPGYAASGLLPLVLRQQLQVK